MNRRRDAPLLPPALLSSACDMLPPRWLSGDGRAVRFVPNQAPDVLRQRLELWMRSRGIAARAGQGDVDERLQSAGVRGHDGDAIGKEHGFVDRVRDEDDGAALRCGTVLSPDAQQLVLQ